MMALISPRDTLWVTASLVMVAVPHTTRLPGWLTLLVAVLVFWRVYLSRARLPLPHRLVLILIVAGATAGVYLHYGMIFGRDAGVALLVVMLALKLLEVRSVRDGMLLAFLSYFLVITNFLYSQTIATAVYMLICVWIITASMIGLHYGSPQRTSRHQLRTAGALLVQSVPLMLLFFVFFPRVQGPLWGMPSDAHRSTTGLSDTMAPGTITRLTLSEEVAFRATFRSPMPTVNRLYWRGPVLWHYDGHTWSAPRPMYAEPSYDTRYFPVEYSVMIEPHGKAWLFALDLPGKLPPRSVVTADLQLLAQQPLTSRVRYDMVSFLDYSYGAEESDASLARALQLPSGFNPRTLAYARELRRKNHSDREVVQSLLRTFREQGYTYTLSPPLLGEHGIDEFMFAAKTGFCEHYSAAFAFVMRAAGIPARVVTGYLGGELNPIGGYLIVRQADAHAWNEVWLKDEGWVRVDPTAAVSPVRVEQGITAAAGEDSSLPLFGSYPLLRQLRLSWDSVANAWNQWVLGYTPERQYALLKRVGVDDATWRTLAGLLLTVTGVVMVVMTLMTLHRLQVRVRDPVTVAYLAYCNKLRDRGMERQPHEGPLSYADRVSRSRPDLEPVVRAFTALYVRLRYSGASGPERVERLRQLAREFRP